MTNRGQAMLPLLLLTFLAPVLVVGRDAKRMATSSLNEGSNLTEADDAGYSSRLTGQFIARPGQFKSTVFVSWRSNYTDSQTGEEWKGAGRCTGIILTPKWVLTAASCIACPYRYNKANPGERYTNSYDVVSVRPACDDDDMLIHKHCAKVFVKTIIVFRDSIISVDTCANGTATNSRYNINAALLKLVNEIVFDDYVGSIVLSKWRLPKKVDDCIVQGFGNHLDINKCTPDFTSDHEFLRYDYVTAGNSEFCRNLIDGIDLEGLHNNSYVCAYNYDRPLKTAFVGDSGAALLCPNARDEYEAVGMLSMSAVPRENVANGTVPPCDNLDTAMIFTSIAYIKPQIELEIKIREPVGI